MTSINPARCTVTSSNPSVCLRPCTQHMATHNMETSIIFNNYESPEKKHPNITQMSPHPVTRCLRYLLTQSLVTLKNRLKAHNIKYTCISNFERDHKLCGIWLFNTTQLCMWQFSDIAVQPSRPLLVPQTGLVTCLHTSWGNGSHTFFISQCMHNTPLSCNLCSYAYSRDSAHIVIGLYSGTCLEPPLMRDHPLLRTLSNPMSYSSHVILPLMKDPLS